MDNGLFDVIRQTLGDTTLLALLGICVGDLAVENDLELVPADRHTFTI